MSIDKTPAVGRFLLTGSFFRSGFCRYAGVITKISKTRIYYKGTHESFTSDCVAVCDTQEEVDQLVAFDKAAVDEAQAVRLRNRAKFQAMVGGEE